MLPIVSLEDETGGREVMLQPSDTPTTYTNEMKTEERYNT